MGLADGVAAGLGLVKGAGVFGKYDVMIYDLHTHTTASDGELTPAKLVEYARGKGVGVLAVTDHDTVDGIAEAQAEAKRSDVEEGLILIPGIELSCQWQSLDIHIVGLNVNTTDEGLMSGIHEQRQRRIERGEKLGVRLARAGQKHVYQDACALAGTTWPGRPHFARVLVERGVCKDVTQAFKKYLGAGKVAYVATDWVSVAGAVDWIRGAGGVAVLAHPAKYRLTRSKLRRLVADFKEAGGQGIEVISAKQDVNITSMLKSLALEFGLYASCGSDYHGASTRWLEMGKIPPLPKDCVPVWELFMEK